MTTEPQRNDSLHEILETAINNSPYLNRKAVQLELHQGHLKLKGRVQSFYQKQMAQEALRGIDGIDEIRNDLEVDWNK